MPLRRPNRLVVDESTSDDNSVAQLNPATMETLQLFRGDTIIVRGKKRKDTGQSLSHARVCPKPHGNESDVLTRSDSRRSSLDRSLV